jgi:hypothetical protein
MDPRVKSSAEDLRAQFERSMDVAREMARTRDALARVKTDRAHVAEGRGADALSARAATLADLSARLVTLYEILQEADAAPTAAALEAAETLRGQVAKALAP